MFKFLKKEKSSLKKVAKQQLRENKHVIESLRDYDEGKKEISTRKLERRVPDIRVTP